MNLFKRYVDTVCLKVTNRTSKEICRFFKHLTEIHRGICEETANPEHIHKVDMEKVVHQATISREN